MAPPPILLHDVLAVAKPQRWVLMLHGLGDSKEGWKPVVRELDLPDTGWIFAQAPDPFHGGWSWFDPVLPDPRPDPVQVARSAGRIGDLLDHLEATRGIRREDLVLAGFSQGCLMTLEVALTADRPFAGVVGISGWIHRLEAFPGAFGAAADRQRILMTHGTADQVIPIELTRPQVSRLQGLGLDLTWREYAKGHTVDPEEELADIRAFLGS